MNCNRFRRDLPDWLRGDLKDANIAAMSAHSSGCRTCAREEAMERHLRGVWKSVPDSPAVPEMWPKVASALDSPSKSWWPVLRPARLAMGSAFALGALCAVLWSQNPGPGGPGHGGPVTDREEQKVVEMVRELREIPEIDGESHLRHAALFLGESERK